MARPDADEPLDEGLDEEVVLARGTSVNVAVAAAFGVAATILFFLLLQLPGLSGTYFHDLCCRRGPVQYATVAFFFWGVALLVLKVRRIRSEHRAFELGLLPTDSSSLIRQNEALQYIRKIKRLEPQDRRRLLVNRIWRALVRFKLLGSAEKVDDLLQYQGEIDAASVESGYGFLKFLIALIPILGFLGTVLGISTAVAGFSAVVNAAGSVDTVKAALEEVTLGLATAFDTTLLALIMSAILMFGLTLFQRAEEVLLERIEDHCLDNLLDRLWVPPAHEQFERAMVRAMAPLPERLAAEVKKLLAQTGPGDEEKP
jgi:biopolymer transport protein ExbB/TolQ